MLPSASESLPSRTQKKLLTFSGSSVASGARIRARTTASTPRLSAILSSSSTKRWAPPTIAPSPTSSCSTQTAEARVGAALARGARRSAGRGCRAPAPRPSRAGCGRCRAGRRAGRGCRPGSAAPAARPRRAPGRARRSTRKKIRSRSRVGRWTRSSSPCSRFSPVEVGEQPDQAHRQGREQEGGADDRPDRDVFAALGRAEQGDDRDQRLRHRRADRGEQAADGALAELRGGGRSTRPRW